MIRYDRQITARGWLEPPESFQVLTLSLELKAALRNVVDEFVNKWKGGDKGIEIYYANGIYGTKMEALDTWAPMLPIFKIRKGEEDKARAMLRVRYDRDEREVVFDVYHRRCPEECMRKIERYRVLGGFSDKDWENVAKTFTVYFDSQWCFDWRWGVGE